MNRAVSVYRHLLGKPNPTWLDKLALRTAQEAWAVTHPKPEEVKPGLINFVSYADMVNWSVDWAHRLPRDYDVVCGIPRPGLAIASVISMEHNKPLAYPEMLLEGRETWFPRARLGNPPKAEVVLLVDDTIGSGMTMMPIVKQLKKAGYCVRTAALIAVHLRPQYYYKFLPQITLEWDFPDQKGWIGKVPKVAVDMDGILCQDCPLDVDLSENGKYEQWLQTVEPMVLPAYKIDLIVSDRLEKYRTQTEQWLKFHGVQYGKLDLWDLPRKADRNGRWGEHKPLVLSREKPDLMYESDPAQALDIERKTGIKTICPWRK